MYELAVWIKMFHMTFSPSHNRGKVVQLVYKPQQSRKFTYNYLYSFKPITTHWSHDFLSIPQPWESCTASVQATAEPQIYL